MIRARWQGFEIESGESPVSVVVANWAVFKQSLIFALFALPILSLLGRWLAERLLKSYEQPVDRQG